MIFSLLLSLPILLNSQNAIIKDDVADKFQLFNEILQSYTIENCTVDYTSIQNNPFGIDQFLDFIEQVSPISHPEYFKDDDAKAYWINVYNALAIKTIIDNPNIESIRDVSWGMGAFWRNKFIVGGKKMTLNHIEHKILRKRYKDPRIHFAINCASNSCPPIGNSIVTGVKLDRQLDKKAIDFIRDDNNVQINHSTKEVYLSRIFKWFSKDFLRENDSLIEYVLKYRDDLQKDDKINIINNYKIKFLKYDWSLND